MRGRRPVVPHFDEYREKYACCRLDREDGVITATLHTDGGSLRWSLLAHRELPDLFHDIGNDPENRVMILTGTGDEFSGPAATPGTTLFKDRPSIDLMDRVHWEGRHLLHNLLNIEFPVITALKRLDLPARQGHHRLDSLSGGATGNDPLVPDFRRFPGDVGAR